MPVTVDCAQTGDGKNPRTVKAASGTANLFGIRATPRNRDVIRAHPRDLRRSCTTVARAEALIRVTVEHKDAVALESGESGCYTEESRNTL